MSPPEGTTGAYPVVVLISGRGSNLQSIIDRARSGDLDVDIRAVICNEAGAAGLERARAAGIKAITLAHREFASRTQFDNALAATIDALAPSLVVLAGFMRILTAAFVERYVGRMINIHPSLLPEFQGLHTHQRALDAGVNEHGASVHFVTGELDGGPVIAQARVPVLPGDDADTLAARVLAREHDLLPDVIALFTEGRVELRAGHAYVDGTRAATSGR